MSNAMRHLRYWHCAPFRRSLTNVRDDVLPDISPYWTMSNMAKNTHKNKPIQKGTAFAFRLPLARDL